MLTKIAIKLRSVSESPGAYAVNVDCEHEHRDAEHEHEDDQNPEPIAAPKDAAPFLSRSLRNASPR
ncbi:hypothetical protein CA85_42180 [Allorhodopirellula solitaria]|uniref:Uncharacterized protein n=1 Tax=Allorhodopirellula solitaria TaxID=2527987 RepID=A0A5C5X2L2_9BACT|nr:hypothetical protein CA85_42180 [Allorhodopirellula solitaria]